jgi:hypothetical protein
MARAFLARFFRSRDLDRLMVETPPKITGFPRSIDLVMHNHRYIRKIDCSSLVMFPLIVLPHPRAFLWRPLTVLTRQTRQAVPAISKV